MNWWSALSLSWKIILATALGVSAIAGAVLTIKKFLHWIVEQYDGAVLEVLRGRARVVRNFAVDVWGPLTITVIAKSLGRKPQRVYNSLMRLERIEKAHEERGSWKFGPGPQHPTAAQEHAQQPDVALVWDFTEEQRRTKELLGLTEKLILVHNRSAEYIYNIRIQPVQLRQRLSFETINEIGPGQQHLALGRWDGRSSENTNYVYFFANEENEKAASRRGWFYKKNHNRGLSEFFLRIPMTVIYEANGSTWSCDFEFSYDPGDESSFSKKTGRRVS